MFVFYMNISITKPRDRDQIKTELRLIIRNRNDWDRDQTSGPEMIGTGTGPDPGTGPCPGTGPKTFSPVSLNQEI